MGGRYNDDPNFDGPLHTPWPVWIGIAAVLAFALWVAFTGPNNPDDDPLPPPPAVCTPGITC